ncbi:MAG: hypothetical protein FJ245_11740 [Nitrospira sp.]|nr:hypothetical protein [Nitrospira sp.]
MTIRPPRIRLITFSVLFVATLSSCAGTPTISNTVQVKHIGNEVKNPTATNSKLVGGGGKDWARTVICKKDGSCAIFGYGIKSWGESTDYFAAMESPAQQLLWARSYGGTNKDVLSTATTSPNGGYLLIGTSESLFFTAMKVIGPNRPPRPFVLNIDAAGNPLWAETVDSDVQEFLGVRATRDGNYILAGFTFSEESASGKGRGIAITKISPEGEVIWAYRYDIGFTAYGRDIAIDQDGSLTVLGGLKRDKDVKQEILLLKLTKDGDIISAQSYAGETHLIPHCLSLDEGRGFSFAGASKSTEGKTDSIWFRGAADGSLTTSVIYEGPQGSQIFSSNQGFDNDWVLAGRIGDGKKALADGFAMLVTSNGNVKAFLAISGEGNDEVMSVSRLSAGKYRLFGDTENFQAKDMDMFEIDWVPDTATVQSTFSQGTLKVVVSGAEVSRKAMTPTIRHVGASLLEVRTLMINQAMP